MESIPQLEHIKRVFSSQKLSTAFFSSKLVGLERKLDVIYIVKKTPFLNDAHAGKKKQNRHKNAHMK